MKYTSAQKGSNSTDHKPFIGSVKETISSWLGGKTSESPTSFDLRTSTDGRRIVAVSGGFDPIHTGHVRLFNEAKKLGDELWVFVNTDEFLINKKGYALLSMRQREEIIENFASVDRVIRVIDNDETVCRTLRTFVPHVFANGGDRNENNIPEYDICDELGIEMAFNVGGEKYSSSSDLVAEACKTICKKKL